MATCAAVFSNVRQKENADASASQTVLSRLAAQLDQLTQQVAILQANSSVNSPSVPRPQPYEGTGPISSSAYPTRGPTNPSPTINLDPTTWISYFFATRNLESLRMKLSRLLHCPYEPIRYFMAERGCIEGFWANFEEVFQTPENTSDERFALLPQEAIRILRINKGLVIQSLVIQSLVIQRKGSSSRKNAVYH